MKIIKFILLVLLAFSLIISCGIFIFLQTFDSDQYLLKITKKVSIAVGRPVSIGHWGVGLSSSGITLDAGPLIIADDPDFTAEPFITIDKVRSSLDLRSLVLQRKIHITKILLQSPEIHFIRDQEGDLNIRSLGKVLHPAVGLSGRSIPEKTARFVEIPSSMHSVSHDDSVSVVIQDASVSFIDQNQGMPLDIWLSNINANLNDLSLSKSFRFTFNASLYSNAPNVQGSALMTLDAAKRSVQISGLDLYTDLSDLNMDQFKDISPAFSENPILKDISGVVQLNLQHLGLGDSGGLEANGSIAITNGMIKDFNLIKTILSQALGAFGGMEDNIENILKGPLKDKLDAENTVIEKAQAKFSWHDKTVFIEDSLVKTDILEFKAQGTIAQGLNTHMQTMIHLNDDVSDALVNGLDGLKYLMDDSKRITIGASLEGVIPHLKYKPNKDFRKKSKRAFIAAGGNILGIFFGGKSK